MGKFFFPIILATVLGLTACGGAPAATSPTTGATTAATMAAPIEATEAATMAATTEATEAATMGTTATAATMGTSSTTGTAATSGTSAATMGTSSTTGATSAATSATSAVTGTMTTGTMTTGTMTTGTMTTGTPAANSGQDLLAAAQANPQLKTLVMAIQAAGLEQTLQGVGPYTIFAPSDQAFASLPPATLQALLLDPATLGKILSYHVANGEVTATQLSSATSVPTLEGQPIEVSINGGAVSLGGTARVLTSDIQTSNGIIHVIDQVLLPPDVTLPAGS